MDEQSESPGEGFVSAGEAVSRLGVTRATLYAYVSRGLVRSVPGRGRSRLYAAEDLQRLQARSQARSGHGPVAAAALRWGEPVISSEITEITAIGPRYRGKLATDLVGEGASYEQVAARLWGAANLAGAWGGQGRLGVALRRLHDGLRPGAQALETLQLALASIAAKEASLGLAATAERQLATGLIARLAALTGLGHGVERARQAATQQGVAKILSHALGGPKLLDRPEDVALVEAALIVSADHELNTSTFAARVVASTGADLHACLGGALAALSGPKHGGACRRVEGLVDEASTLPDPGEVVRLRFARGDDIPGFGHPFYPDGDPRAQTLIELVNRHPSGSSAAAVATLKQIATAMDAAGHPQPALDFGLVLIASALGLPRGSATALFALGRACGWVAHILEQREQGFLLRPRARYSGSA